VVKRWAAVLLAVTGCAHAGTILHTGDELRFSISDRGFVLNSLRLGGPAAPTLVSFQFSSEPIGGTTAFSAELESPDGTLAFAFAPELSFAPASFAGALYNGPTSALSGSLRLPETTSQQIFPANSAVLVLRNDGPAVEIGLSTYSLQQELSVTFAAANFSVGATRLGFALQPAIQPLTLQSTVVPEPGSGVDFALAGSLFWGLRWGLKLISSGRIK